MKQLRVLYAQTFLTFRTALVSIFTLSTLTEQLPVAVMFL